MGVSASDVDECSLAEKVCTRTNENCYNTPGSYVCVCPEGFEDTASACVRKQPAGAGAGECCGFTARARGRVLELPALGATGRGAQADG